MVLVRVMNMALFTVLITWISHAWHIIATHDIHWQPVQLLPVKTDWTQVALNQLSETVTQSKASRGSSQKQGEESELGPPVLIQSSKDKVTLRAVSII